MVALKKVRKTDAKKENLLTKIQNKTPFDFGVFDKQKKYTVIALLVIVGVVVALTVNDISIYEDTREYVFEPVAIMGNENPEKESFNSMERDYTSWFDGVSAHYDKATKHEMLKEMKKRGDTIENIGKSDREIEREKEREARDLERQKEKEERQKESNNDDVDESTTDVDESTTDEECRGRGCE